MCKLQSDDLTLACFDLYPILFLFLLLPLLILGLPHASPLTAIYTLSALVSLLQKDPDTKGVSSEAFTVFDGPSTKGDVVGRAHKRLHRVTMSLTSGGHERHILH